MMVLPESLVTLAIRGRFASCWIHRHRTRQSDELLHHVDGVFLRCNGNRGIDVLMGELILDGADMATNREKVSQDRGREIVKIAILQWKTPIATGSKPGPNYMLPNKGFWILKTHQVSAQISTCNCFKGQ